jgi:hypothetical protein
MECSCQAGACDGWGRVGARLGPVASAQSHESLTDERSLNASTSQWRARPRSRGLEGSHTCLERTASRPIIALTDPVLYRGWLSGELPPVSGREW